VIFVFLQHIILVPFLFRLSSRSPSVEMRQPPPPPPFFSDVVDFVGATLATRRRFLRRSVEPPLKSTPSPLQKEVTLCYFSPGRKEEADRALREEVVLPSMSLNPSRIIVFLPLDYMADGESLSLRSPPLYDPFNSLSFGDRPVGTS